MRLARETEIFTKKGTDNRVRNSFNPRRSKLSCQPGLISKRRYPPLVVPSQAYERPNMTTSEESGYCNSTEDMFVR